MSKGQSNIDDEKATALYYATSKGKLAIVKYLIEEGIKEKNKGANTEVMQEALCYAAAG